MTSPLKKLTKKLNQRFAKKQNELYKVAAVMGDGAGGLVVANAESYVYVIIGDRVAAVFNNKVIPQIGTKVWVGYDSVESNLMQVLSTRSESPTGADAGAVGYAPAKRYEWHAVGGGQDPLYVHVRAMTPLRLGVSATANTASSLYVDLHRGYIYSGTDFIAVARQDLNLFSHIPSAAGKAALVLITINTSGAVIQTKGAEVNTADLVIADLPAIPADTAFVCGAVRVYTGQTLAQDGRTNTDFWDARFTGLAGATTAPMRYLVMSTGVTNPPVPTQNAGGTDWIYTTP